MAQTGVQFDKSSYNYGKIKQGVHKSVILTLPIMMQNQQ